MEEKPPSSFKFRIDDVSPETLIQARTKQTRHVEKPGGRGTYILIFVVLLISGLLVFTYHDTRQRIGSLSESGSEDMKKLTREMESKLAELNAKYASFEESLNRRVSPMDEILQEFESVISSVKAELKKIEGRVNKVEADKIDKKEVTASIEDIKKNAIVPVQDALKTNTDAISGFDERITKEVMALTESIDAAQKEFGRLRDEFAALSVELSNMSSNKLDTNALNAAMKEQSKVFQDELNLIIKSIDNKGEKIAAVESRLKSLEKITAELSKRIPIGSTPLKPGKIIEQDIE